MKKLDAGVFLRSAEFLGNKIGACRAIAVVCKTFDYNSEYHKFFNKLLKPYGAGIGHWYGYEPDDNLARQLGLLLCAEVLKDEQKGKRK